MTSLEQGTDTFVSLDELTTPVYVEDVAQFIYGMLLDGDTLERCGVLHLSSEKALSLFDIVEKQAVNLGVSTRKLYGRLASELSVSSKKPLVHGLRPSSGCLLPF
jgi:dTDP-4-dehydrorhamnose reductase